MSQKQFSGRETLNFINMYTLILNLDVSSSIGHLTFIKSELCFLLLFLSIQRIILFLFLDVEHSSFPGSLS